MEEVMSSLFALGGLVNTFSFGFTIAMYVLSAWGMYTIANRRGIHRPWLAWIPVANMWILGSISDQYQLSVKNKKTNRRKILLTVNIIPMIMVIALVIAIVVMLVQYIAAGEFYVPQMENPEFYGAAPQYSMGSIAASLTGAILLSVFFSLAMAAVSIVAIVFACMSYYDLYMSCNPSNAVLFLVLGILFGFLNNIFVFVCKDKDEGMRPPEMPRWEYSTPPE